MTAFRFLPVTWHATLASTNTSLVKAALADNQLPAGTVIAARTQTAGRGRQQRGWQSAPNENLTFSFLWRAPVSPHHVPSMAQCIAIGIARTLVTLGLSPTIKWPNDVHIDGKKIGGILCERVNTKNAEETVIVAGIGLNVNMGATVAAQIDQPATSIALETGHPHDVDAVLAALLEALSAPLNAWAVGGFGAIAAAYSAFSVEAGTPIRVRDGAQHLDGVLHGYGEDGALQLACEGGVIRSLYSGDVYFNG